MRKNIALLILLLVLIGIAYTLINKNEKVTTLDSNAYKFSVENTDEIYKLFIADRRGNKITLRRGPEYWTLDNKHRVHERIIESTLNAIGNLDISSIPPKAAYANVMKELATKGVKVEAYDKNDKKIKSFYLGGTTANGYETQIIMEGYDQPYHVQINGSIGEVVPRFLKRYDDWRDPYIFRDLAAEVDTFSIFYPRRRNESFIIARDGNGFNVNPAFETTAIKNGRIAKNRFKDYFYNIEKIGIETYFNKHSKIDSFKSQVPVVSAYLKKRNGEVKRWDFIEHGIKSDIAQFNSVLNSRPSSRYLIVDENNDGMLGQQQILKHIFWGYSSFFNKSVE